MERHPCKRKSTQEEEVRGVYGGCHVELPRPAANCDWTKIRSTQGAVKNANSPDTLQIYKIRQFLGWGDARESAS